MNLEHRGAVGAEKNTGDGAGILARRTHHMLQYVLVEHPFFAFTSLLSALGNLPFIGFVALAATVADLLWPLSDPRRQALHDKVADTQVVVGHQKR